MTEVNAHVMWDIDFNSPFDSGQIDCLLGLQVQNNDAKLQLKSCM